MATEKRWNLDQIEQERLEFHEVGVRSSQGIDLRSMDTKKKA